MFAIPAPSSLRQEDHQRLKASLGYRVRSVFKKKEKTSMFCSLSSELPAEYSKPPAPLTEGGAPRWTFTRDSPLCHSLW